jgi:hypothetical protein
MKTIRLSESQLVDLINKVVTENQFVGAQGMSPMPEATAVEQPKKEQKPKKKKSRAQLYYDKIISTKNELERLNDSLTGERDIEIKNKFRQIETLMKTLQSLLGKRDDVNALK